MADSVSSPSASRRLAPDLWILDRDGTILTETGYLREGEPFELLPGAAAAIARLNRAGHPVAIATNQSAIARGWLSLGGLDRLHRQMDERLAREGARIDAWFACPHHPEVGEAPWRSPCTCRKPAGGLIEMALAHFRVRPEQAVVVGDSLRDLEAATAAGVPSVLVRTGKGAEQLEAAKGIPLRVAADLAEVVDRALGTPAGSGQER